MAQTSAPVRKALQTLQTRMRQRAPAGEQPVNSLMDKRSGAPVQIPLTASQVEAMKAAEAAIAADPAFEHLDPAEPEIEVFATDCVADKSTNHVGPFMDRYSRSLVEQICYFSIQGLGTPGPAEFGGIRLLPVDDPEIPATLLQLDPLARSVAAVPVTGTGPVPMASRARKQAQHALSVLRMALRQPPGVNPQQLRFVLGTGHVFSGSGRTGGWQARDDIGHPIDLPADLTPYLAAPAMTLPITASKGSIDEKALLAMNWLDRADFTPDLLVATLFRFFALEALLGDRSEGLKSGLLALRQMTLSRLVTGHFRDPDDTLLQYDEVRSYAVHGEIAENVSLGQANQFEWAVRDTFNEYLELARQRGCTRRSQLTALLDDDTVRGHDIVWIRERGSPAWADYLGKIEPSPSTTGQEAAEQEPG
jgi:hypothetical protein